MKKFVFILSLLFIFRISYAQYGVVELVKADKVKNTETVVVVDYSIPENKELEEPLERALKKAWTVSGYKIMDKKAVLSNIKKYYKSDYSFIYIQYEKIAKYGFQPTDRSLLLTFAITMDAVPGNMPPVTAIAKSELNYNIFNIEAELIKDLWILQDQIKKGLYKFGDANPVIKERTLLIPENLLGKMTAEEITKVYLYPFKIVNKEELSNAIINRTPNTCFVEHTNIPQPTLTVIDIVTGAVIYQGVGEVPIYGFVRNLTILKDHIK